MHDKLTHLLAKAPSNSAQYHFLFGAFRAIQWVLGFDAYMVGPKFEESIEDSRKRF
jgi:hypothetical protein